MSYCLNPNCPTPDNLENREVCASCGAALWLQNRYMALKPISQGGFGRTFLAIDASTPEKSRCVIKHCFPQDPGIPNREKSITLFRQEAEQLRQLGKHPQIPQLLEYIEQDGQQYLIQEWIDGPNLQQELTANGNFSDRQITALLLNLLPVLQFVHDHQVIHRDIKPANIIQRSHSPSNTQATSLDLVLVDLGAAKQATGTALGKTGTIIGSAEFTAPEQARGKATFSSDLYSLGVTCIYLLTGVSPFELYDSGEGKWVWRHYLQKPIGDRLGHILDRMIEGGTNRRFQSANEILKQLQLPPHQTTEGAKPQQHWKAGVIVLSVLALGTAALTLMPQRSPLPDQSPHEATPLQEISGGNEIQSIETSMVYGTLALTANPALVVLQGRTRISNFVVQVWNINTGEQLRELKQAVIPISVTGEANDFITDYSGIKQLIAIGSETPNRILQGDPNIPYGNFMSQQKVLMGCSIQLETESQRSFSFWNIETGQQLNRFNANWTVASPFSVTPCALSPDGQTAIIPNGLNVNTTAVELRDVATGQLIRQFRTEPLNPAPTFFMVSPNGQMLAIFSQPQLEVWDLATGALIQTFQRQHDVDLKFHPTENIFVTAETGVGIRVWNRDLGSVRLLNNTQKTNYIALSPDGYTLAWRDSDDFIHITDLRTETELSAWRSPQLSHLIFTADNQKLVGMTLDGMIKVWSIY